MALELTLHTSLPEDADFKAIIARLVGYPCDIKILHVLTWRYHLLLAERYRDRRVFLAGDSAHLVIPTGGLGIDLRHEIAKSFRINHARMHGMRGAEFGYTYTGSAILDEDSRSETWDTNVYTPHTRPGARASHMWLSDGRPLQDVVAYWYTLLDFGVGGSDISEFEAAFRAIGAPLTVVRLD
jgi:hypothetical protein